MADSAYIVKSNPPTVLGVSFKILQFCYRHMESKKDGKDQESIQWSITPDPGYHMGK